MNWSLRVGRFFGIALYVHWTFAILLAVVFYAAGGFSAGPTALAGALERVGFVVAVFVCVTLHEYGHALAARYFGIRTRDITILPFGGLARLEIRAYRAWEEFVIAVAGPAVNVVIAAILGAIIAIGSGVSAVSGMTFGSGFIQKLCFVNVVLVVFNMIPAFPMDGGRVLRSLLARFLGLGTGTLIAARVGQGLSVLLIAGAFTPFGSPMLAIIGVFVFLAAQAELRGVQARLAFERIRVGDVMRADFGMLLPEDPISAAVEPLFRGQQPIIPIMEGRTLVGIVGSADIRPFVDRQETTTPVRAAMRSASAAVRENATGAEALDRMQQSGSPCLPVLRDDLIVGLVTFADLQTAAAQTQRR